MTTAEKIQELKSLFYSDPTLFDFKASTLLSGDGNKKTRQELIKEVTGKEQPINKCGYYQTINALTNSFKQHSLF